MKRQFYLIAKRTFDVIASVIGLIVLLPVFAVIGIVITCETRGPIFYRGLRTGRYGRPFFVFKFRSMFLGADQRGGPTTGKDDARVTRVGHYLRKYKLDELPQLINVVLGDMSLVGPRPEVPQYTDAFNEEEKRILLVRPGITDLASIEFCDLQEHVGSHNPDMVFEREILPRKNQLRLKYVDEKSFGMDLYILAQTLTILLQRPFRRGT